jgi:hypothetical protein
MRDFGSGWGGLKDYAVKVGVATADDGDDAVAAKIQAVIQGTLPEQTPPTVTERIAAAVGRRSGDDDDAGD